jgi:hypothetical protein
MEMQNKITMTYYLTLLRMASIKKTKKMLERRWMNENSHTPLVEIYISIATKENSMEVPQETKNRFTI